MYLLFLIGDNILAMLKYLATSDMLAKSFEYRHGNVVFFDVLGLFVLAYPARVGTIMNYVIAAIAFLYLGKKVLQPKNRGKSIFFFLIYCYVMKSKKYSGDKEKLFPYIPLNHNHSETLL